MATNSTRRHFLQAGPAAAATLFASQSAAPGPSPNDHIQIAVIGIGIMGSSDLRSALSVPGVRLTAAADVYEGRLTRVRQVYGKDVFTTRDYREVLARRDVDAVLIAVPDHWHARIAAEAMEAGKDVYLEKPMVQKVEQGAALVEVQRKTGRILQVGSQRVSSVLYQKAKDLLKAGAIGRINMVEAWWDRNSSLGAWQYSIPSDASLETVDWDRFLGPAPKRPFDPVRLFRWRNYQDYGTGVAGDLFVHLFSGLHFILDSLGPHTIFATGGLRYWKDGREVPDVMLGLYGYESTPSHPDFTLTLRVNFKCGAPENSGFRFVGSEGILTVGDRSVSLEKAPPEREPGLMIDSFPQQVQEAIVREYRQKYPPRAPSAESMEAVTREEYVAPRGYSDHLDHHRVFFSAVRTRRPVVEDALFGFRAAAPAVLSNVSYAEKRVVRWDPERTAVVG